MAHFWHGALNIYKKDEANFRNSLHGDKIDKCHKCDKYKSTLFKDVLNFEGDSGT